MNQTKRLLFYLLVNVIVSACTILSILWLWDRPDKPLQSLLSGSQAAVNLTSEPSTNAETSTVSTRAPTKVSKPAEYPKGLIAIENIVAPPGGSAADETVVLQRIGTGELQMAGWKLEDTNGNIFVFPELTLFENGAINIHTSAGINTVIDLYWNKTEPVWQVGETATLLDPLGNIQATFKVQ
jgi:hypothetical protein